MRNTLHFEKLISDFLFVLPRFVLQRTYRQQNYDSNVVAVLNYEVFNRLNDESSCSKKQSQNDVYHKCIHRTLEFNASKCL